MRGASETAADSGEAGGWWRPEDFSARGFFFGAEPLVGARGCDCDGVVAGLAAAVPAPRRVGTKIGRPADCGRSFAVSRRVMRPFEARTNSPLFKARRTSWVN